MPTIDISLKDLSKLIGKEITRENLEAEALLWVKGEIDGEEGDLLKIDCKESNRPDLWSTEGMARALAPFYTKERGIRKYTSEFSDLYIHVDRSVDEVRPFITAAVISDITNSETTGKVTEKTKNLFLEVTGTNLEDCKVALNVMACALADRGGKVHSV